MTMQAKMIVIKKDFVAENTMSYYYNRPLSSAKAFFVKDENGKIHYASKKYVLEHLGINLSKIPDFTTALISIKSYENSNNRIYFNDKKIIDYSESDAITYMILREEKLINYNKMSYPPLNEYYQKYQKEGKLSPNDIKHIMHIDKKSRPMGLSLDNLLVCYAYEFMLDRALNYLKDNKKGVEFISGLKLYLRKNRMLTKAQIDGLKAWLQYLPSDLGKSKFLNFKI